MKETPLSLKFSSNKDISLTDLNMAYGNKGLTFDTKEEAIRYLRDEGYEDVPNKSIFKKGSVVAYLTQLKDLRATYKKIVDFDTQKEADEWLKKSKLVLNVDCKKHRNNRRKVVISRIIPDQIVTVGYLVTF